ncbi:hypothetical protein F2P79_006486 [Pimephales promelas]|nr:hypothetical protein F2P79_006486 [Pimephales promelas]
MGITFCTRTGRGKEKKGNQNSFVDILRPGSCTQAHRYDGNVSLLTAAVLVIVIVVIVVCLLWGRNRNKGLHSLIIPCNKNNHDFRAPTERTEKQTSRKGLEFLERLCLWNAWLRMQPLSSSLLSGAKGRRPSHLTDALPLAPVSCLHVEAVCTVEISLC